MSDLHSTIISSTATILIIVTGIRLLLQESIAVVKLYKELRTEIQKLGPTVLPPQSLNETDSKRELNSGSS